MSTWTCETCRKTLSLGHKKRHESYSLEHITNVGKQARIEISKYVAGGPGGVFPASKGTETVALEISSVATYKDA